MRKRSAKDALKALTRRISSPAGKAMARTAGAGAAITTVSATAVAEGARHGAALLGWLENTIGPWVDKGYVPQAFNNVNASIDQVAASAGLGFIPQASGALIGYSAADLLFSAGDSTKATGVATAAGLVTGLGMAFLTKEGVITPDNAAHVARSFAQAAGGFVTGVSTRAAQLNARKKPGQQPKQA